MTTYTVYQSQDFSICRTGLTLDQAANELLTGDGYTYEIRPEDDGQGWRLWISRGSQHSYGGTQGLISSVFFSLADAETEAAAEIFQKILGHEWHGQEGSTDEQFTKMLAEYAAEADAE